MKRLPRSLIAGNFTAKNIHINIVDSKMELGDKIENRIDEIYKSKKQESTEKGLNFYNGLSYRLVDWSYDKHILHLNLAVYDFKHRYGLSVMIHNGEIDRDIVKHNGCYVGSGVTTADNKCILVELSGKSTNPNRFDLLGGVAELDIPCESGQYLFDVLYKELEEEANILKKDIKKCNLHLMYSTGNGNVGFYFETVLNITEPEIRARFINNRDDDIKSLTFINKDEYLKFLENSNLNKRLIKKNIEIGFCGV